MPYALLWFLGIHNTDYFLFISHGLVRARACVAPQVQSTALPMAVLWAAYSYFSALVTTLAFNKFVAACGL